MKRKVIKQGYNTLTITLPNNWVKNNNIKAGDEINLHETEKEIVISAEENNHVKKASFDTEEIGFFKNNYICCLHHAGFDEIEIFFHNPEVYKEIQKKLKDSCQGFEIVEQTKNRCYIKAITNVNDEDFDKLVRRIFLMLNSLFEDLIDIFKTKEFDRLDNIRIHEELNNRCTAYCKRILAKKGYPQDRNKTMFWYVLMYYLETIADDYKHLVDFLKQKKKIDVSPKIINYLTRVKFQFNTFYELFYKFNKNKAIIIFNDGRKLFDEGINLLESSKKSEDRITMHYLVNTVIKTYEMTEPYLEMNLCKLPTKAAKDLHHDQ